MKHDLLLIAALSLAVAFPAGAQSSSPKRPSSLDDTRPAAGQPDTPKRPSKATPPRARPAPVDPFGGPATPPKVRPRPIPSEPDPFGGGPRPSVVRKAKAPLGENLNIRYEVFSLDVPSAAVLLRANFKDLQAYQELVKMVETGKAVQEALVSVTTRSEQRASSEAVAEHIYPTEYDPPNTPTTYDTRNTGVTVEVEPIVDPKSGEIHLRIAPEHVNLVGNSEWGPGDEKQLMPEFESRRLATSVKVTPGVPRLLGTVNRPPRSKQKEAKEKRIWIAFATVSPVK